MILLKILLKKKTQFLKNIYVEAKKKIKVKKIYSNSIQTCFSKKKKIQTGEKYQEEENEFICRSFNFREEVKGKKLKSEK